jgi:transcriptional regulator
MYLPKHFSVEDNSHAIRIGKENSFATVISFDKENEPFINHLPLIVENDGDGLKLIGHMARRNPQWQHFMSGSKALVIFNGPHTYITPTWYVSGRDVPTWNYVVVHAQGKATAIEDFDRLTAILKKLTDKFERDNPQPWEFELPDDLLDARALTSAIVGFEIHVEKIEAKFKLSQNRSAEDKRGIIEGLSTRSDDMSRAIRLMMEDYAFEK